MGLLNAFNEWKAARNEKHISLMRENNNCPECYGRGFLTFPSNEFSYTASSFECPGCNGSGLYSDWSSLT